VGGEKGLPHGKKNRIAVVEPRDGSSGAERRPVIRGGEDLSGGRGKEAQQKNTNEREGK